MATKHPKHRIIPRVLLKNKLLVHLEDKVVLGLHVFELIVILLLSAITTTVAVFLPNFLHNNTTDMTDKETKKIEEIVEDEYKPGQLKSDTPEWKIETEEDKDEYKPWQLKSDTPEWEIETEEDKGKYKPWQLK